MNGGQERTEPATPKRRERARREGNVARSTLAPAALSVCFAAAPLAVAATFSRWWIGALALCASSSVRAPNSVGAANELTLAAAVAHEGPPWLAIGAAWLAALAASVGAAAACGAVTWSPAALRWKTTRLSPAAGARSIFSVANAAHAAGALLAACAVFACAIPALNIELSGASALLRTADQLTVMRIALTKFWSWTSVALLSLAAVDVVLARRQYAASLRMTRREYRDERAELEGKPEVKSRRRSLAARASRRLRLAALKHATAVVTNPEHIAVALRYAPPAIEVPVLTCAGKDAAAAIVRVAAELNDVPIVESPELARALYARVGLDEPIPDELYAAVAAVFAWIVKTRGALRRAQSE